MQSTSINERPLSQALYIQRKAIFHEVTLCVAHMGVSLNTTLKVHFLFVRKQREQKAIPNIIRWWTIKATTTCPGGSAKDIPTTNHNCNLMARKIKKTIGREWKEKVLAWVLPPFNEMFSTPINWIEIFQNTSYDYRGCSYEWEASKQVDSQWNEFDWAKI